MRLKICCQICGKFKVLQTAEPQGTLPRWSFFKLPEIVPVNPSLDWEVWICPACLPLDTEGELDGEQLEKMILSSLQLKEEEKRHG